MTNTTSMTTVWDSNETLYIWDNGMDASDHTIAFITSYCDERLVTELLSAFASSTKTGGVIARIHQGEQTWLQPSRCCTLGQFLDRFLCRLDSCGAAHRRRLNALPDEFLQAVVAETERDPDSANWYFDSAEFVHLCRQDPEDEL